eukprot:SAG31_NODE_195_length_20708_cov_9.627638_9_plen_125_part_00
MVTSCSSDSDGEAVPRKERVMKLLRVYADDMTEVEEVEGGNIAAIIGLKATRTGDTLNGRPAEVSAIITIMARAIPAQFVRRVLTALLAALVVEAQRQGRWRTWRRSFGSNHDTSSGVFYSDRI